MDFQNLEELSLPFVDQEAARLLPLPTINNYSRIPKTQINFGDIFDLDQSENNQSESNSNFFGNNHKAQKDQKQQLTIYLRESMGGLKARRKTIHHIPPINFMKAVHNVTLPNNYPQLLGVFLTSNYFLYFIRLIVLLNLFGIFYIDYSFRTDILVPTSLSSSNVVSLCIQLFANCVFTLEIGMRFYKNEPDLRDPYLYINLLGTIATWISIFFDMIQNDDNTVFQVIMMVRIGRAIIRIMEVFDWLRTPFQVFLSTIPSLQKLFFPFLIIALFYSLTGMALYSGSTHYLCTSTSNSTTTYNGYCGSSEFSCSDGEQCQEVSDSLPAEEWNQYNLINFDNIGNALLTVYHFIYNANFSLIRGKFSSFINPYISSVYFVSMSIFFFFIFSNLIMISMSKAYMEQIENKKQQNSNKEAKSSQQFPQEETSPIIKMAQLINFALAVIQSIIIGITYSNMSDTLQDLQSLLDFALSWASFAVIIFLIVLQKQKYFKQALNIIDLVTILCHLLDLIICAAESYSVIYSQGDSSLILRSLKVLRIIRILYISDTIFVYQKYVIQVFIQTTLKVKAFLLLCMCFALMFKEIGELLFAFKVRFNSAGEVDIQNGTAFINNFQSFSGSLYSIFYLFLNQGWSETMYVYYAAVGWPAVVFFVIVVFIAHMMLMRLYIAVFLSYFREELRKKSKQELIRQNNHRLETLREIVKKKTLEKSQLEQPSPQTQLEVMEEVRDKSYFGCCAWPLVRSFYHSNHFQYFINGAILMHALTIIVRTSSDSDSKTSLLTTFENICFSIYIIEVALGCFIEGIYISPNSYLRRSKSNFISFAISLVIIMGFLPFGNELINGSVRRIAIFKIFTLFRQTDKEMTIVLDTIGEIIVKFFKFLFIYALFLSVIAIIPLKFLSSQSNLFNCQQMGSLSSPASQTEAQCIALGGAWQQSQNFDNIFTSISLLYQLVSSQSWSSYINGLIQGSDPFGWELFFIVVFFVYNICFLNIMMGFIVQTYLHLKDKAYNLNLLKQSQRCWVLIKNSIHCLAPRSIITLPPNSSSQRKLIFRLVFSDNYQTTMDYLAYFNAGLYLVDYYGQTGFYAETIQYCQDAVMFCFVCEVVLKTYVLRGKYLELPNSYIQFFSGIYVICYALSMWLWPLGYQTQHIMNFFLACSLLLRCKSLLVKYSWCKTHLNSVIDILPKCGKIIKLVCALLFFYAALGLQLFKYIKPDDFIDNYNIGYNNFLTSVLTLVRVSVSEGWYQVVSAFLKQSTSSDLCYTITNYSDAMQWGGMGCGSWVAWPYFLSFHVAMVLLVLNLLIATMASAYDDNYEIQYNSVNIFQLEDCLNLWQKYDPQATGVVHYKKFWRLTSEIAILFGISKKKLIKRKNKFFQELDLQIYQQKDNPILCYRFHDVITKFSKIKLQVANLGSEKEEEDSEVDIEFDISPFVLKEIKDYITPFPDHLYSKYTPFKQYKSGQTKYIFGLLKKLRQWKHLATEKKRLAGGTKLSSIFDIKSKKHCSYDLSDKDLFEVADL